MERRVLAICVLCLIETTTAFCTSRYDPWTVALEQLLTSEITFEIVPCPPYPNICPPACQCGLPACSGCNMYGDIAYDCDPLAYPACPNIWPCDQCGLGSPSCNCYRDIVNPCSFCEDISYPVYICFDNCDCDCGMQSPPPFVYFPEVEYPMSAMDIRPYYYGSCWCA